MTEGPLTFGDHVRACWDDALDVWGVSIHLSPPMAWNPAQAKQGSQDPLAYIDMVDRQVVVNFDLLAAIGAFGSLTGVLAHEIGHHVAFPHTLGLAAGLEVLQHRLITYRYPLTNLFFDLQVNERVGQTRMEELAEVYRGFTRKNPDHNALFTFYLGIYEELWGLPEGDLVGAERNAKMEEEFPAWRGEARMFAQTFYALPDVWLQFVYFLSVITRYLPVNDEPPNGLPMASDCPSPGADDYAGAVFGNPNIDRAIAEGNERGWLDRPTSDKAKAGNVLNDIAGIGAGRPGSTIAEFKRQLVSRRYAQLVEEYLLEVPPAPGQQPDPLVPTTLEDWDWGDSPLAIDWTASVLAHGPLAAITPLKRTLEPADPEPTGQDIPAIAIWLDTSGSMPNPAAAVNTMTLAALILAAAAIRHNGLVRGVVYSSGKPLVSEWMRDEKGARDFLLNYAGGGTDYPFAMFAQHAEERPGAIHVVVSDGDYLWNVKHTKDAIPLLQRGIDRVSRYVALLAIGQNVAAELEPVKAHPKFQLVRVAGFADFAKTAADLSRALFGEDT